MPQHDQLLRGRRVDLVEKLFDGLPASTHSTRYTLSLLLPSSAHECKKLSVSWSSSVGFFCRKFETSKEGRIETSSTTAMYSEDWSSEILHALDYKAIRTEMKHPSANKRVDLKDVVQQLATRHDVRS
eukprot:184722-Hanusia_phi.AAC.2